VPPPRDVTSAGTCGLAKGAGERPPEASRKPINLGMARFIGDTVDALAVKFTALSTPGDNKDTVKYAPAALLNALQHAAVMMVR